MSEHDPRFRDDAGHDGPLSGLEPHHAVLSTGEFSYVGRDVWSASASFGWLVGSFLLLLAGAAIVLLLVRVPSSSVGQRVAWVTIAVALAALVVGIAVLLRALPTMRYRFAGDALSIEWFGQRRVVLLQEISDITFEPAEPLRLPRWEPFWPGYYVATVRTPSGTWHSWATQQPHRRVRLHTANGIVAISPERPVRFIAELERRRRATQQKLIDSDSAPETRTTRPVIDQHPAIEQAPSDQRGLPDSAPRRSRPQRAAVSPPRRSQEARNPVAAWLVACRDQFRDQLLTDPVASALVAVGVVLPVLMVAYLYSQYEGLPTQVPIQWDATGEITAQTAPSGLWRFPRIAVVILVVNTAIATLVISTDRHLARLLVSGIPLAQLILFIALIRAVN